MQVYGSAWITRRGLIVHFFLCRCEGCHRFKPVFLLYEIMYYTEKAFIINVPHGKVITAITQDEMKDSVFTNIDGAVFL